MAITAVIGDTSSVGATWAIGGVTGYGFRRNPQLATARIRTVVAPHIVSDAIGGWISADFTIPAEEALRWKPVLRYGAATWLFDGLTPIFYGWAEQPVWTQTGDCQMTISGAWGMLAWSRMREAWDMADMTQWTKAADSSGNENKAGQMQINSAGKLTLSFPNGSTLAASDRCSIDYLLFGETVGTNDTKLITAFSFDITDQSGLGANMRVRVIGKANAAGATGDLLYDQGAATGNTGIQGALNLDGTNQGAAAWTSTAGYRCLRIELITLTARTPLAGDTWVTFDDIRVGTRESMFPSAVPGAGIDTGLIARKVVTTSAQIPITLFDLDLPPEFWPSNRSAGTPDTNTQVYKIAGGGVGTFDPVVGPVAGIVPIPGVATAIQSGIFATGFCALEWQSPADILSALVAIDGFHVGFYLPYNGRGGYDPPGSAGPEVGSFWLSAPPHLYYQPFPDPNLAPDYVVYTRQGAQVTQTAAAQPLVDREYVNYQTQRGHQQSAVTTDANTNNYATAQGFARSEDYTIQPAVGSSTLAANLGQQQLKLRRHPFAAATITITNDGSTRTPILQAGASVTHLATIRPGSVRIADISASVGLRAGYATHVEWWGATLGSNEHVEISLADPPGQVSKQRAHGIIAKREHHTRTGPFTGH